MTMEKLQELKLLPMWPPFDLMADWDSVMHRLASLAVVAFIISVISDHLQAHGEVVSLPTFKMMAESE
jgi:hypothetical protein